MKFYKNSINKKVETSYKGLSFTGALTIAFIVLKLCNIIDWSWWWVLSPIWIPISIVLLILIISILILLFLYKD